MCPRSPTRARQGGLSLIDLLVAVVIVSILAAYGVQKVNRAGDDTLWYQAQRLARDIRHAQVLSSTWGRQLVLTVPTAGANGTYKVACVTAGAWPCNADPIVDPTTGNSFTVTLQNGVSIASPATPARFDVQGRPLTTGGTVNTASTSYTLTFNGTSVAIAVAPVTGYVTTTP